MASTAIRAIRPFFLPIILMFAFAAGIVSAADVSSCQTIFFSGAYTLTQDVSSDGMCFEIWANDLTLDCDGHTITNTGSGFGVYIDGHSHVTIKNCNIIGNPSNSGNYGIYLRGSSNNLLMNNTISSTGNNGIYLLYDSNFNTLINNTASNNAIAGIYLTSSSNNIFTGNTVNNNNYNGIYLISSSNNVITGMFASSNNRGISIISSMNNTVANNVVNNSYHGIYLESSSNNTINSNTANSNKIGIYLDWNCNNNTLSGNTAIGNIKYGISIENKNSSSNIIIDGNNRTNVSNDTNAAGGNTSGVSNVTSANPDPAPDSSLGAMVVIGLLAILVIGLAVYFLFLRKT